jgi:hypothetical protein
VTTYLPRFRIAGKGKRALVEIGFTIGLMDAYHYIVYDF